VGLIEKLTVGFRVAALSNGLPCTAIRNQERLAERRKET